MNNACMRLNLKQAQVLHFEARPHLLHSLQALQELQQQLPPVTSPPHFTRLRPF